VIPRRIALRGFLCYHDEQVLDFDGCDLWVFTGRNGSGKSAVFDAMTYALFAAHRGGKQDAASLIHAGADSLAVTFEFDLGPHRYRARRSLRRNGRSERQIFRREPAEADGGDDRWPAVPETQTEAGFKRWIEEHIGLTYETFTASVLLMQGRADNLLSTRPRERFEILAGVVDLASYRRIHDAADRRRQRRQAEADALREQLRSRPEIDDAAIAEAAARLDRAAADLDAADRRWRSLIETEAAARSWVQLSARLAEAESRRVAAQRLIDDSAAIARDYDRLRTLDALLPALDQSLDRRNRLARALAEARAAKADRLAIAGEADRLEADRQATRQRLSAIAAELDREEARRSAIRDRAAALAVPIHRARAARDQRVRVDRLASQVAAAPADLEATVDRREEDVRIRIEWKAALPWFSTLDRERRGLREALDREVTSRRSAVAAEADGHRIEPDVRRRLDESEAARAAVVEARDRRTRSETLLRAAEARLTRFAGLEGAPDCDRCGQPLTPAHFAAEESRLRTDVDRDRAALDTAARDHEAASARSNQADAALRAADAALAAAVVARDAAARDRDQAARDAARHAEACQNSYEHLSEPFRSRIAPADPPDWAATAFPAAAVLDEASRQAHGLGPAQQRSIEARAALDRSLALRRDLEAARLALAAIGDQPGDDSAEAEQSALDTESAELDRALATRRADRLRADQALARLAESIDQLDRRRAAAVGLASTATTRADELRNQEALAIAALPEPIREPIARASPADRDAWTAERQSLDDRGTERLAAALPGAQLTLARARADVEGLARDLDAIPESARRPPEAVAAERAAAESARAAAESARRAAQAVLDALGRDREARADLARRAVEAEGAAGVAARLARLLGRDGLQRDLLRDAERAILAGANPILRELSGGEIELRNRGSSGGDDPEHALQLDAIVRTHGASRPIDVAYLSGSQRFRVAVSLALAIGQYARGLHRPIESVIIDEGFGSLDPQGRREMIDELKRLKGRLARVVLVSHQEEFAEAFADGYRFEVVDGTTVARPFHR